MNPLSGLMALALVLQAGGSVSGPRAFQPVDPALPDTSTAVELDVPYLAQGPLLCGGAAAAMVERFYGARGVYAEDFRGLVRPSEGGIRTTDLVGALRRRGYRTEVLRGGLDGALRALKAGSPPILLLRSGEERFHYVVLVGWEGAVALVHDPVRGPQTHVDAQHLKAQARGADFWTLLVRPAEARNPPPATEAPAAHSAGPLADAVEALRAGDEARAEALGQAQLARSPGGALRALSWQLVATARFRAGRHDAALDAWNHLGEPRVDLIVLRGLHTLRWPTVAGRLPFRHGDTLRSGALATGRRRLATMPGVTSSRLDYQPLIDGSVEVRGFVAEAGRWPSLPAIGAEVGGAVADRRASLSAGPFLSGGERWTLSGQWLSADASARLDVRGPVAPLPGVATITLAWERQRFDRGDQAAEAEERTRGVAALSEWISPADRVHGQVGLERWTDRGHTLTAGASMRHVFAPGRLGTEASVEAWAGGIDAARGRLRLDALLPRGGREWQLRVRGAWADRGAPRLLWDGAGLGLVRHPLLRGVRLVRDGRIDGPVFGPRLVQASVEHSFLRRIGPLHTSLGIFADAARSWGGSAEDSGWRASWGLEVAGTLDQRRVALSLGTGAGEWIVSLRLGRIESLY